MISINNHNTMPIVSKIEKQELKVEDVVTVESLTKDLKTMNDKNHTNLKFIDILESLSTEEKMSVSKDGQELLDKLNEEINKKKGGEAYFEDIEKEMDKFLDLQKEMFELRMKIQNEEDSTKRSKLEMELIKLEGQLLSLFK